MTEQEFVNNLTNYASIMHALAEGVRSSDLDEYGGSIYEQWVTLEDLYDELQTQVGYLEDALAEKYNW